MLFCISFSCPPSPFSPTSFSLSFPFLSSLHFSLPSFFPPYPFSTPSSFPTPLPPLFPLLSFLPLFLPLLPLTFLSSFSYFPSSPQQSSTSPSVTDTSQEPSPENAGHTRGRKLVWKKTRDGVVKFAMSTWAVFMSVNYAIAIVAMMVSVYMYLDIHVTY